MHAGPGTPLLGGAAGGGGRGAAGERSLSAASAGGGDGMMEVPSGLREGLADRYTIERELGRGGMATVYLARDLRHDRPVALKLLHPDLAHALGPERFLREIKFAARLQHPHILTLHDSGNAAGSCGIPCRTSTVSRCATGSVESGSCRWARPFGSRGKWRTHWAM